MPGSWVNVLWTTKGRDVFLNGNLEDASGQTGTPFVVETGMNTFTLLKSDGSVQAEKRQRIAAATQNDPVIVDLRPRPAAPPPPAAAPTRGPDA